MSTAALGRTRGGDDGRRIMSSASLFVAGRTSAGPLHPGLHVSTLAGSRIPVRQLLGPRVSDVVAHQPRRPAPPRLTRTAGAKSFLAGLRDPHSCALWRLGGTLLLIAAFWHSSTNAASRVCPTTTVRPPAHDPRDACAASTSTTSPGVQAAAQATDRWRHCQGHLPPMARGAPSCSPCCTPASHLRLGEILVDGGGASLVERRCRADSFPTAESLCNTITTVGCRRRLLPVAEGLTHGGGL
jgi:hypothetical protein